MGAEYPDHGCGFQGRLQPHSADLAVGEPRSGRKILTQDFERQPPAAALAMNLTRLDYAAILYGSIEELPRVFAELDAANRAHSLSSRAAELDSVEAETASLSLADKRLIRSAQMEKLIATAGR